MYQVHYTDLSTNQKWYQSVTAKNEQEAKNSLLSRFPMFTISVTKTVKVVQP